MDRCANEQLRPKVVLGDHSATELLRQVKQAITSVKSDVISLTERPGPLCENNQACEPLFDEMAEISYDWFLIGQPQGLRFKRIVISNTGKPGGFATDLIEGAAASVDLVNFFKNEKILYNRTRARWFESHDTHSRTMQVYPNYWKNFVVLISTVPGVPFIHAGQETGETKADYFSGTINEDVKDFYKKVFSIRSQNSALKYGDIKNVWKDGDNVYAYSRTYENETAIVVINFNGNQATSILNMPSKNGKALKDELSGEIFTITDASNFKISVPDYSAEILTIKR